MADTLRVLACQVDIPPTPDAGARDAHLARLVDAVSARLKEAPADLVVLPELSSIDYSRAAFGNLSEIAESARGASFEAWRAVAERFDTTVLYSHAATTETGYRIRAAAVDGSGGLLGHYDKTHLAQCGASMEQEYFERGDHVFVFEVAGFRIAPIICFDIRFPELCRALTLDHAVDVIAHVGAYARDATFPTWHQFVTARALENQVHLISLSRAGDDFGGSIHCPPWIDDTIPPTLFPDHAEAFARLTLDRASITAARDTFPYLKDRLNAYDLPVTEPGGPD